MMQKSYQRTVQRNRDIGYSGGVDIEHEQGESTIISYTPTTTKMDTLDRFIQTQQTKNGIHSAKIGGASHVIAAGKPSDPDVVAARRKRPSTNSSYIGRPGNYGYLHDNISQDHNQQSQLHPQAQSQAQAQVQSQSQSQSQPHRIRSREELEKSRLVTRIGSYERYYRNDIEAPFAVVNDIDHSSSSSASSPARVTNMMYQNESQRLDRQIKAADELKRQRLCSQQESTTRLQRLRYERQTREDNRWNTMRLQHENEMQRIEEMRQKGLKSKRNEASVPYDLITLQYGMSDEAQRLRQKDERTRHRAAMRAYNLTMRQNNSDGINPITGEKNTLFD